MKLGYIGLGKMGTNMVLRLIEKKYDLAVYNRSPKPLKNMARKGVFTTSSLSELVGQLKRPRTLWLMVPHAAVDGMLKQLVPLLAHGDTVIDGGNSLYSDSIRRGKMLAKKGIIFLDVGVSGGPSGARHGACLMVGGPKSAYKKYEPLWRDLSVAKGYGYMGQSGAGHFVKMAHNGIEYGMMQSLAEGFALMKKSPFKLSLTEIARVYDNGSVITSRLTRWLNDGLKKHGEDLTNVSGSVGATGEGEWTVAAAKRLKVPVRIIEESFLFRQHSKKHPSYIGKILSLLRNQFGGHAIAEWHRKS